MGVRVTWVLFYGGGKNDLFHDVSNNDFTSTSVGGSAHRGQMIAHDRGVSPLIIIVVIIGIMISVCAEMPLELNVSKVLLKGFSSHRPKHEH